MWLEFCDSPSLPLPFFFFVPSSLASWNTSTSSWSSHEPCMMEDSLFSPSSFFPPCFSSQMTYCKKFRNYVPLPFPFSSPRSPFFPPLFSSLDQDCDSVLHISQFFRSLKHDIFFPHFSFPPLSFLPPVSLLSEHACQENPPPPFPPPPFLPPLSTLISVICSHRNTMVIHRKF